MVKVSKLHERIIMDFQRTTQLIGEQNMALLKSKTVAIFGIGGVGSYVFEGLIRSGIGKFILVDKDVVDVTNINRQLVAYQSTIACSKVLVAKERGLDINPKAEIAVYELFYLENTMNQIDLTKVDYIIDAIDNVTAKILLIEKAKELNIPIISCMGTGNKLDNTKFVITDISKTHTCPLARIMRKELKDRKIEKVKVVFSTESPVLKKQVPASISFVPSVAGLMIAGEVVRDMID